MQPTKQTYPRLNDLINELTAELQKLKAIRYVKPEVDVSAVISEFLSSRPGTHRKEIAQATGLHPRAVSRALELMQAANQVVHIGNRRGSRWFLTATLDALTAPQ